MPEVTIDPNAAPIVDMNKKTAYDRVGPWSRRDVRIEGEDGEVVFAQANVEAPDAWSDRAVTVVASKYFRGNVGFAGREDSVRDLVGRVVTTIGRWALEDGYSPNLEALEEFEDALAYLLLSQSLAFNTPVWLNVGVDERPQCSACFISGVEDTIDALLEFAKTEALIFKKGGGSGANLSAVRGSNELLSKGGVASGPVSFMRGFDAFAGVIKSGGRMRRAAKMVCLNADHPDILDFVRAKRVEEGKAAALIAAGYGAGIDGEAIRSVFFQNANHSVRVTDAFMKAVERDELWCTTDRKTGDVATELPARELWREIVESAHACGDPGLQFDDATNRWHTSPAGGRISASNPCAEFVFLDDSACNLASLNLRAFQDELGNLDVPRFEAAVDVAVLAQDVIVDRASYPTEAIGVNARRYRPLGLGYANLGAFLMAKGLAYDSDEARALASAITALMTGRAYRRSAELARARGTFAGFDENRGAMLGVIDKHLTALYHVKECRGDELEAARSAWVDAHDLGVEHGFRNAQVTLLAPTGTIAFMMDCDTTGIEPDIALRKEKELVGGGTIRSMNGSVDAALCVLGYDAGDRVAALEHLEDTGSFADSILRPSDLPVFDCALSDAAGRAISVEGHLGMMAAVQPFLSGAISKTVNLAEDATEADVAETYRRAWELGLKAISIYRDGSKNYQPVSSRRRPRANPALVEGALELAELSRPVREKLPEEARTVRHHFDIGGVDGYFHVGLYDDGRVGEVFTRVAKEGSTISGLLDAFATAVSLALQHGTPFDLLVRKFAHWRFEPSGFSTDDRIGHASSIVDYLFRWLEVRFPGGYDPGVTAPQVAPEAVEADAGADGPVDPNAPSCGSCGALMRPNGSCHVCPRCGSSSGCS
jgi:ribonucleoside-diphosphate reductase alpha chain